MSECSNDKWLVRKSYVDEDCLEVAPDKIAPANGEWAELATVRNQYGDDPCPQDGFHGVDAETYRIACLIAAAPELLEALQDGVDLISGDAVGLDWVKWRNAFIRNSKAAIAKARGEAQ